MKIAVIHGQSHRGSTAHIAQLLAQKLGGEVTEFFLPRDFDSFCTGCTACFLRSERLCPHAEKLRPITEALDGADVILLESPVYVYHVTGAMKALLDHYGYRWMIHRPEEGMFHKQVVCLSTAAGAGMKSTTKDMADSAFFWGAAKIYRYGVAVAAVSWEKIAPKKRQRIERRIDRLAEQIRRGVGRVRPGVRTRLFFHLVRILQRRGWNEADVAYWREKGWDGKRRPWN